MKKKWILLCAAAVSALAIIIYTGNNLISSNASSSPGALLQVVSLCGATGHSPCTIGSIGPGGGTIFFVDYNNDYPEFDYLEVAPAGWYSPESKEDPALPWCADAAHIVEPSSNQWSDRKVGVGKLNTSTIISHCTTGAAAEVQKFNISGHNRFNNWFLPSIGELVLLTQNMQGLGDLMASDYWSSSEYSDIGAWVQSVGHGYQGTASKLTTFKVRPIRSF
jgi:hypothetical protein